MRERPNRTVSKTVVGPAHRGFKSHSLRQLAWIFGRRPRHSRAWSIKGIGPALSVWSSLSRDVTVWTLLVGVGREDLAASATFRAFFLILGCIDERIRATLTAGAKGHQRYALICRHLLVALPAGSEWRNRTAPNTKQTEGAGYPHEEE